MYVAVCLFIAAWRAGRKMVPVWAGNHVSEKVFLVYRRKRCLKDPDRVF